MKKILITGATGELGSQLRPRLLAAGYDLRGTSRRPVAQLQKLDPTVDWVQVDLATGEGVTEAVQGVDGIIHAASDVGKSQRVDVAGTERLLHSAEQAGVNHLLYISIVGIDRIPFRYYRYKLATETVIEKANLSWSILRATQFPSLLDMAFHGLAKLPIMMVPTDFQFQLIDSGEVADMMIQSLKQELTGRLPDLTGPVVQTAGELVKSWLPHQPFSRRVWHLPIPGQVGAGFRAGYNTFPERPFGNITWADWLHRKYGQLRLETAV